MTGPFDLIFLADRRWDLADRTRHLAIQAAREHRVFFVEPPVFERGAVPHTQQRRTDEGVHLVVPHLPTMGTLAATGAAHRDVLSRLVAEFGLDHFVLWLATPAALPCTHHLTPAAVVYDCSDDPATSDAALFRHADVVFAAGASLSRARRPLHANLHLAPNGVSFTHFARARGALPAPADQARIPHPRIGFFGVIDRRIDLPLVAELAARRPGFSLIMIGPVAGVDPVTLPRRSNIHWLGTRSDADLPAYAAGWNAAILPLVRDDSTLLSNPLQTAAYLAAGKPVVATSIDDVRHPYADHGVVTIADTADELARALDEVLDDDALTRIAAADRLIVPLSWERTWRTIEPRIEAVARDRVRDLVGVAKLG